MANLEFVGRRTSEALPSEFNPLDFKFNTIFPQRFAPSGWISHVPFAFFVVEVLRPRTIVELGTYHGVSYCAFCQAVKSFALDTRCYAIDTWRGDSQTHEYDETVLAELRAYHDPLYSGFSSLLQCTFDEGLNHFADRSIDLLHIDGFHTYDTVRHDFMTWLPKLSNSGIILLHDIHEHRPHFGVWKLWDEVKAQYPHFELLHSHGLGLLAVGRTYPPVFARVFSAPPQEQQAIRDYFSYLGEPLMRIQSDQLQFASQGRRVRELEEFVARVQRNPFFRAYHWLKYQGRK